MSLMSRIAISLAGVQPTVKALLQQLIEVATVAALGSVSTDAAPILKNRVLVTGSDGAKGVRLPAAALDASIEITNTVADQDLLVYPASGEQINALTVTTGAFTQAAGSRAVYLCDAAGHWYVAAANLTGTATTSSSAELNILTGALLDVDELNLLNGVTATTAELNMAADSSANTEIVVAANVLTAAESGKTFILNAVTTILTTLPAVAAGLRFKFIVGALGVANGQDHAIVPNAANDNTIFGGAIVAGSEVAASAEGSINIIGTSGTTALPGDVVEVFCDGTNWYATGRATTAGAITFTT